MQMSSIFFIPLILLITPMNSEARTRKHPIRDKIAHTIDAALVSAPIDNETCFSPDEPCDIKLVKFVESAKVSLDIAIYDINLDQLVHAILVQSKKISVRLVVDKKQAHGSHSSVSLLRKAGVQLRFGHQRGIMHNKFSIIDGKRLETGSFNYTGHAATANQENQMYLSTPSVVGKYVERFEKVWYSASKE